MVALPVLPEDLSVAPLTPADAADAAALLAEAEKVDDTGEHWSAEDLTEWWVNDLVDLGRDGVAVRDPAGALVAWATVLALPTFRDAFRIDLEARVHPAWRGRGIGRALLAWQVARGGEIHADRHPASPAVLGVSVPAAMTSLGGVVRRAGFRPERWYRTMARPLSGVPAVPGVDGMELVPFSWNRDEEVRQAHNASFTEHHGSAERDAATWRTLFTGQRAFRPDLSVLALADGAVVGYALAYVYEADSRARGHDEVHLGQIGVLPAARGRGVASALITAVLRAAAAAGCRTAGLDVDSGNVTGAPGVYERLGFRTTRTQVSWSTSLPAVAGG
ncbi:mycothiol synthase [Blastococcus aurantiacus]|uniref:Mycothiol synthase n=1 Tax=Blastococcus aurantiacus TaxID=1550231 RepID=A0A1G7J7M7_9ACTN|nr:GNAT family N-acetyltransferase [Blastococcus aurantiacus]SDF20982.1 mycothiol synthase [Blastococcus aurantiacus]